MGLNFTKDGLDHFGLRLTRYVEGWLGLEIYGFVDIRKDEKVRNTYYLKMTLENKYNREEAIWKLDKGFDGDGFRYDNWSDEYICIMNREGLRKLYTLCKMLGVEES